MQIKYIEAYYLDDKMNQLSIVSEEKHIEEYKLYWTYDLDACTENKTFLLSSDKKDLVFEFPYDRKKRNYFIIEFRNHKPMLFGHRILPVDGMYNLRDVGGYPTETGKRIKWGVLYRSDYFALIKDSGLEYVKNLGFKTIIDYREEEEIKGSPNRKISNDIVTYVCDPNAHTAMVAGALHDNEHLSKEDSIVAYARKAVEENPKAGDLRMIQQQLSFIENKESREAFKKSLKVLSEPENNPSVQHCRGGKDRTGFGLMLLEGILGVPKDIIVYDYMLTKKARAEKNVRYYQKYLDLSKDERVADYLFSLFDTKPEYIEASINKIVADYGSIKQYAKDILDVDDEMISKFERTFLEE